MRSDDSRQTAGDAAPLPRGAVALDRIPERMSDVPPALISILSTMVAEAIEYEHQKEGVDGSQAEPAEAAPQP